MIHVQSDRSLRVSNLPHMHAFGLWEEAGEPEGTHADTHANSTQKAPRPGIEATTFLLGGGSANHCATVLPVLDIISVC